MRIVMGSRGHGGHFGLNVEQQQNDESHIVNINVHGFTRNQIKLSRQGRIIKIRAESDNKRICILREIQVPKNGELNSINAKFEGGVLSITIPKKEVAKPHETIPALTPKGKDVQNQTPTPADEKSKLQQESPVVTSDGRDDLTSKMVNKETKKKATEFPEDETVKKKALTGISMNKANNKKILKGLAELNEERQFLVNIGVALLVVLALTTYVTCKFASGKAKT